MNFSAFYGVEYRSGRGKLSRNKDEGYFRVLFRSIEEIDYAVVRGSRSPSRGERLTKALTTEINKQARVSASLRECTTDISASRRGGVHKQLKKKKKKRKTAPVTAAVIKRHFPAS